MSRRSGMKRLSASGRSSMPNARILAEDAAWAVRDVPMDWLHGKTVMLTTHYMEEAERLCSRVAVMDRGRAWAYRSAAGSMEAITGRPPLSTLLLGQTRGRHGRRC